MATQATARSKESDWTKPQAMAIPKEGYFELTRLINGSDSLAFSFCSAIFICGPGITGPINRFTTEDLSWDANLCLYHP